MIGLLRAISVQDALCWDGSDNMVRRRLLMHLSHVVALSLLITVGCAWMRPVLLAAERPSVTTPRAERQQPPAPPATRPPTPRGKPPAPAPDEKVPAPQPAGKTAPPDAATAAAQNAATAPPLDLKALEQRLRNTKAIGIFTKITLKNQVSDLLDKFEDYYDGKAKHTMKDLRLSYDLLLMKVLSLLQDEDQQLASAIVASREAIWVLLADPKTFATLRA
jgi:hypothetical protein